MATSPRIKVVYVTSSQFKVQENQIFVNECHLADGALVGSLFTFDVRQVVIREVLEVDLVTMVTEEVKKAYQKIRVPCIVEHAGLIFDGYSSYPGGLTKPMWNVLGDKFIDETQSADRKACAQAVVAYCDGMKVETFEGRTPGRIAQTPRGAIHKFYWDTVFIPDDPKGMTAGKTYAEIVEDPALGLSYKVRELSQSSRAMLKFLEHRKDAGNPLLWPS